MKKKFLYIAAVALSLGVTGCEKFGEFGDTNKDPGAVTEPVASSILANGLNAARGNAYSMVPGYYAQYFAETQYPQPSVYTNNFGAFAGTYAGSLYDFEFLQTLSSATNNQKQVAIIIQQQIIQILTDQMGDIPYSEAMKGIEFTSPKYDTQEEIYKGMLSKVSAAVAALDNSPIAGDVIYNGNVAKWKKLGNSIRVLMAVQLSKRYPNASDYAATQYKAAVEASAGGTIEVNADNWQVTPPAGYSNPYWSQYATRRDNGVSDTYVNLLLGMNDDRLKAHTGKANDANVGSTKGVPYGIPRADIVVWTDANPDWATIVRGDLREQQDPHFIITAGQILLARAEAAQLGWDATPAATFYARGVEQSFLQWGRTSAEATTYLAQASVALGTDNVRKIATQRYIAHFPDGMQGWNIWRKTGFPVLTPAIDDQSSGKKGIPHRYLYAVAETTSNPEGLKGAVDRFPDKKDDMWHKVWWAQ